MSNSAYGTNEPITDIRIKEGATYAGAALQMYVAQTTSRIKVYAHMNEQVAGWTIPSVPIDDNDIAAHDALIGYNGETWAAFSVATSLDLEEITAHDYGGIATTGGGLIKKDLKVQGTSRFEGNVGFFGSGPAGAQSATAPVGMPLPPAMDPSFDPELDARLSAIESALGEVITGLNALGLFL